MGKYIAQPRRTTRASRRLAPCVRLLLEALEERCLLSGTVPHGQLPLAFEVNVGQAAAGIEFVARGSGYALALTPTTASLSLQGKPTGSTAGDQLLQTRLVGANPASHVIGQDLLPGVSNYLVGDNPAAWHTNIPNYGQAVQQNVYPGIDLLYVGTQGQLEYDFVVQPGANPGMIRLAINGARSLTLDAQGDLILQTANGVVVEKTPLVYQQIGGVRRSVAGRFVLLDHQQVGFAVGAYDASQPLVIDPVLSYSTYLGGSGGDISNGIAVDAAGEAFMVGYTDSTDFPTVVPVQAHNAGGTDDVFVTKLNAAGTAVLYSTYLGGTADDKGYGIAVDRAGSAYVTGATTSTNFPTAGTVQTTNPTGANGTGFVTKLNAAGTTLVYSWYVGNPSGTGPDQGNAIAVDSAGSAYVTGFQTLDDATKHPFLFKLNPGGTSGTDVRLNAASSQGNGIAVDSAGEAFVAGSTLAVDFPTAGSPAQPASHGNLDAFVVKFNAAVNALIYGTYLGGSGSDTATGIALDGAGNAYVSGLTSSTDFPTASALQTAHAADNGGLDGFITKLNTSGSTFVYSTYLGGSGSDSANSIAVDVNGSAFVAGSTGSSDFPIVNAVQPGRGGGFSDAFVVKVNPAGSALSYSTFLGGSALDSGTGVALDSSDAAYVTGSTASTNFPTLGGPQATNAGSQDAFVVKLLSHTWRTVDVAVSSSNQALLLWDSITNDTDVWSVTNSFAANVGAAYGHLTGWTAVATAAGLDGLTRVLFTDTDGSTALWLVRADGMLAGAHVFAPISGWTAQDITVGSDGNTRVLWTNTSGAIVVWSLDGNFNVTSSPVYGPISGWTARSIAAGGDGLIRVLWDNVNGQAAIWLLNASGTVTGAGVFGPFVGWTATDVAVGPDNRTRILWGNVNGSAIIWNVSNSFAVTTSTIFGPLAGWTAERLADGSDGVVRLLWDNVDGTTALWLLDANGNFLKAGVFGPV